MNREVHDKFVAALRSGKYEQIIGELAQYDDDGKPFAFCVMGVLCDVAAQEGVFSWPENKDILWKGTPSEEVTTWSGLSRAIQGDFIQLNDQFELSFEDFAELIDGHYDDLAAVLEARCNALSDIRDEDEDWWEFDEDDFEDAERLEDDDEEEEENV